MTIFFLKIKVSNLSNFPLISITSLKQSKLNDDLNLSSSAANWPTLCITLCAAMNPIIGLFRSLTPSISARQKVKATASRVNFAWYSLVCLCSMWPRGNQRVRHSDPGSTFPPLGGCTGRTFAGREGGILAVARRGHWSRNGVAGQRRWRRRVAQRRRVAVNWRNVGHARHRQTFLHHLKRTNEQLKLTEKKKSQQLATSVLRT